MKRSLTTLAFALGAGLILSSCMKNEEVSYEDQMKSSGSTLYSYGASYHYLALGPAYIALRLNTLLYEADNHVDGLGQPDPVDITATPYRAVDIKIGSTTVDVRSRLFANATFTRTGTGNDEVVTITYPTYYDNGTASDYEYRGKIIIVTHGNQLAGEDGDQNPTLWTLRTDDTAQLSRGGIYLKWGEDDYTIYDMNINASDFQSYIMGGEDYASSWDVGYWFEPGAAYRSTPSYENYLAMAMQHGGSSEGSLRKDITGTTAPRMYYTVSSTLTTQFKCSMNAFTSGTETISAPDFKAANPESFPESTAKMTWSQPNESSCVRYGVLTYAGYSAQYTF